MRFLKRSILSMALAGIAFTGAVSAETDKDSSVAAIEKRLHMMIPNADSFEISPTPLPGLYQVVLGVGVIYMSADGNYLIQGGDLVDLNTRQSLTREVSLKQRQKIMAEIPEESLIIYPGDKNAKRHATVTVFTDIDCQFCRKLHLEIPALNKAGVTVRFMAYPRVGVKSDGYKKAVSVWCSGDRNKELDMAMRGKAVEPKTCDNPVLEHMKYADMYQVNGTPNIVLPNGTMIPGYAPADKLLAEIYAK